MLCIYICYIYMCITSIYIYICRHPPTLNLAEDQKTPELKVRIYTRPVAAEKKMQSNPFRIRNIFRSRIPNLTSPQTPQTRALPIPVLMRLYYCFPVHFKTKRSYMWPYIICITE